MGDYAHECKGKRTYSKKAAKYVRLQMMADGGKNLECYKCFWCDWWHVGHAPWKKEK